MWLESAFGSNPHGWVNIDDCAADNPRVATWTSGDFPPLPQVGTLWDGNTGFFIVAILAGLGCYGDRISNGVSLQTPSAPVAKADEIPVCPVTQVVAVIDTSPNSTVS